MYFPKVDPVQIAPLDLGEIQNNNLRAQAMRLQNTDEQRKQNALATYKDAIDQGASPEQAANALRAMAPEMADRLTQNTLTLKTGQAALSNDMDKFIQTRVPLAKDQAGWDSVLNEASARYGIQMPDTLKTYSPELQQNLLMGGLSAAQRITQQRQDATAEALGLPPGVDPGTYSGAASTMQSAQQRSQMFPYQLQEAQDRTALAPLQRQSIQSEIDARNIRAAQPKVIMIPDPNDPLGMKKVPGYYDQGSNSVVPMQVAPGQGDIQPPSGQQTLPPPRQQGQQVKQLDAATAKQYLQKAGGDANKARALALADGWSF